MSRRKPARVAGRYYTWRLYRRGSVWAADGRANRPPLGRHSLGTKDREEADRELARLDLTVAVRHKLADESALAAGDPHPLSLDEGVALYLAHAGRPRTVGGVSQDTADRYRAVLTKFAAFAKGRGLTAWGQVRDETVYAFLAHPSVRRRGARPRPTAPRTQRLEADTVKQVVNWLIARGRFPASARLTVAVVRPRGSDTYCWTREQVRAMLAHCRSRPDLGWLEAVLTTLVYTGLRISEAAGLRWADVNEGAGLIVLTDERAAAGARGDARTLKSGEGRNFAVHAELGSLLARLPRHPDGHVLRGPDGSQLNQDGVRLALIREVLAPLSTRFPTPPGARKGFADGRLHSFRHFFVSLCSQRGVDQRTLMRWIGHRDSKMVEYYYHLHDDENRRQMARVSLDEQDGGTAADGSTPGPVPGGA